MKNTTKILVIATLVLLAGIVDAADITATIGIEFNGCGNNTNIYQNLTLPENSTAFEAINLTVNGYLNFTTYPGGYYINGIKGCMENIKNSSDYCGNSNTNWFFFVNYESASVGVSGYNLNDGDLIEMVYTTSKDAGMCENGINFSITALDYFGGIPDASIYLNEIYKGSTDSYGIFNKIMKLRKEDYILTVKKSNLEEKINLGLTPDDNVQETVNFDTSPINASLNALTWLIENQNQTTGQLKGTWIWDDCFGLWAFNYFLYKKHEDINDNLNNLLKYVRSGQLDNSGWGFGEDVDSTGLCVYGALINGLSIEQLTKNNKTPVEIIAGQQGNNGGFVSFGTENVQTTAWGIIGLAGISEDLPAKNNKTPIDYLRDNQQSDGSWSYMDKIYDTSAVLIALKLVNISPDDDMIENATNFLILKQRNDGSFSDNDFHNSLATLALESWNAGGFDAVVNKGVRYLIWKQHSNGGVAKDNVSEPQSTVTALAALALAKAELEKLEKIKVGLVIKFPDNTTITRCVNVREGANGKEIFNASGLNFSGKQEFWGYFLECINNSCSPDYDPSNTTGYWFWSFNLIYNNAWSYAPVGIGPGGDAGLQCWDKGNFSGTCTGNEKGHYCAQDGGVLGFNATTGRVMEIYTFDEICNPVVQKADNEICSENYECLNNNCFKSICRPANWECDSDNDCSGSKYCSSGTCRSGNSDGSSDDTPQAPAYVYPPNDTFTNISDEEPVDTIEGGNENENLTTKGHKTENKITVENKTENETIKVKETENKDTAIAEINRVEKMINDAKDTGADVTNAENKLNYAKKALEKGRYDDVIELAGSAQELIDYSKTRSKTEGEQVKEQSSNLWLYLLIILSLLIILIIWKFKFKE